VHVVPPHVAVPVGHWQVLNMQTRPASQTFPQAPQFLSSVSTYVQAPLHITSPKPAQTHLLA